MKKQQKQQATCKDLKCDRYVNFLTSWKSFFLTKIFTAYTVTKKESNPWDVYTKSAVRRVVLNALYCKKLSMNCLS